MRTRKWIFSALLVTMVVALTGCGKDSIADGTFEYCASNYVITDISNQYADYPQVEKVLVASAPDGSYDVEYYDFTSSSDAAAFFTSNKEILEVAEENGSYTGSSVSGRNHGSYRITQFETFSTVAFVEDKAIYVEGIPAEYKDYVITLIESTGF